MPYGIHGSLGQYAAYLNRILPSHIRVSGLHAENPEDEDDVLKVDVDGQHARWIQVQCGADYVMVNRYIYEDDKLAAVQWGKEHSFKDSHADVAVAAAITTLVSEGDML